MYVLIFSVSVLQLIHNLILSFLFLTSTTGELHKLTLGHITHGTFIWATMFLMISLTVWVVLQAECPHFSLMLYYVTLCKLYPENWKYATVFVEEGDSIAPSPQALTLFLCLFVSCLRFGDIFQHC